jgi:ABC transporter with metal-binding/Fe-S-binding domain ATP-binding protein
MRVGALFSGGKDSTYAVYVAQQMGWEVDPLVTLFPREDSMMFHHPNVRLTPVLADAMGLHHVTAESGDGEEAELEALREVLGTLNVDGVVTGAVASDYQHSRINRVGHELGVRVFSPLWRKDQMALLRDILSAGFRVCVVGVFAEGLDERWLGRILDDEAAERLEALHSSLGVSPTGEGGEYESLVLDGPNFRWPLRLGSREARWEGVRGVLHVRELCRSP